MPPQIDPAAYETNFRVPNQVAQAKAMGGGVINPGIMYGLQTAAQGASSGIPYMLANFIAQYPYFEQQFPQTAQSMGKYLPNNPSQYAPYGAGIANGIDAYGLFQAGYGSLAASSGLQGASQILRSPQVGMDETAGYVQTGADALGFFGAVEQFKNNPAFALSRGIQSGRNLASNFGLEPGVTAGGALDGVAGAAGVYSGVKSIKDNPVLGATQIIKGGADLYSSAQNLGLITDASQVVGTAQAANAGAQTVANGGQVAAETGASSVGGTLGAIGSYAGVALGAYNVGKTLANDNAPAKDRAEAAAVETYKAGAGYATAGISTAALYALGKISPKGGELVDKGIKNYINFMYPGAIQTLTAGLKMVGSKKGDRQMFRDQYRKMAREQGILDENWGLKLDDGTVFDAGADGSKLDAKSISKQEGFGDAASAADAISAGMGLQGKQRESLSLLFAKAALSSGDSKRNLQSIARQHGLTGDSMQESLDKQHEAGDISDNEYMVWSSKAKDIFGGKGGTRPLKDNTTPEAQSHNRDKGAEVLGIPKESVPKSKGTVEEYIKKHGIKPGQSFRIPGNPNMMSVQPDGRVIGTLIGFDESKVDYNKGPEMVDTSKAPKYDINLLKLGIR